MLKVNISSLCRFGIYSKKYSLFIFVTVTILVYGFLFTKVSAQTNVDADIVEDTTWTKEGSPYILNSSIYVSSDAILTIESGVVVKFTENVSWSSNNFLYISGKIIVNGTESDPVYFTSNYDDVGGSTDDDYEDCYYENYDEENNGLGSEICEMVDVYEPNAGDWGGIDFQSSNDSVLNNIIIKYAKNTISLESSNTIFNNLNISDCAEGLTGYDQSKVDIKGGSINALEGDAFTFFDDSSLSISNFSVTNVVNGFTGYISSNYKEKHKEITTFDNAVLNITDSIIECSNDGITLFNNYSLKQKGGSINCSGNGIVLFNEVSTDINGVKISGANDSGIISFNNTKQDTLKITNSEVTLNENAFFIFNTNYFTAHRNSIHDNNFGVNTFSVYDLDFTSNFWGDKVGPTHISNPLGKGDSISDHILYNPYLKVDPLKEKTGLPSIMFIPGFEASRLYKMVGDEKLGTSFENKLWEPGGVLSKVSSIYMDENGESIDKGIYTRDIIKEATVFGIKTVNFYKSFAGELDNMVSRGEINEWKPVAYDWRFSPLDIVNRGKENNGNISYTEELKSGEVPYIIDQLEKLVENSNSGKVTIVTHSNGGLVVKALIAKLEEMKKSGESDIVDYIDNLVVVAPPLVGTPKATFGLLHGYDQGMFNNILLGRKLARDFGQNLLGAYGLVPSGKYWSGVEGSKIFLDDSLDKLNNWRTKYGEAIDTYSEFENFLLDKDSIRDQSSYDDLVNPKVLNSKVFDKAKLLHDTIDNLAIPENIKVYKVAGWGIPTAYDLHYQSKNKCIFFSNLLCSKKKSVLSSDVGITSGGDGTVVSGSALFGEGEKYYLNLEKYNIDNSEGKLFYSGNDHSNIFEVSYVYELLNNILKRDISLPKYITKSTPSPVNYTIIKMRSPVDIDIYDENNLHTGVVEGSNSDIENIEESIPNSMYMEILEDKYIVVPTNGNYTLKLKGVSDGIFTLEQQQIVNDIPSVSVVWKDIPVSSLFNGEVELKDNLLSDFGPEEWEDFQTKFINAPK